MWRPPNTWSFGSSPSIGRGGPRSTFGTSGESSLWPILRWTGISSFVALPMRGSMRSSGRSFRTSTKGRELRPPAHLPPYRHHPVTSITRSAVPAANPDATVTFPAGVSNSPRIALGFRDRGKTFLLVSHLLDEVRETCTRAIWISEGRIERDGPAVEVCDAYRAWAKAGPPDEASRS